MSALPGRWRSIYQEPEGESVEHDDIIELAAIMRILV
jgi:hypothetical protein